MEYRNNSILMNRSFDGDGGKYDYENNYLHRAHKDYANDYTAQELKDAETYKSGNVSEEDWNKYLTSNDSQSRMTKLINDPKLDGYLELRSWGMPEEGYDEEYEGMTTQEHFLSTKFGKRYKDSIINSNARENLLGNSAPSDKTRTSILYRD